MQLTLRNNLLVTSLVVVFHGQEVEIPNIVVDTGSANTMISTEMVAAIGLIPEPEDILHVVRGVAGAEVVFSRCVDRLQIGSTYVEKFEIEVGGIDETFNINGILGLDFLLQTQAILNLGTLSLDFPSV